MGHQRRGGEHADPLAEQGQGSSRRGVLHPWTFWRWQEHFAQRTGWASAQQARLPHRWRTAGERGAYGALALAPPGRLRHAKRRVLRNRDTPGGVVLLGEAQAGLGASRRAPGERAPPSPHLRAHLLPWLGGLLRPTNRRAYFKWHQQRREETRKHRRGTHHPTFDRLPRRANHRSGLLQRVAGDAHREGSCEQRLHCDVYHAPAFI
mmetsp:Transcript_37675/g.82734  ORF Transcript_37675/g.82734 Transcript_37675/m.82734 type:complete len:207 (+) Transcript_37675:320-940(+)